jgi:hypothetical protein
MRRQMTETQNDREGLVFRCGPLVGPRLQHVDAPKQFLVCFYGLFSATASYCGFIDRSNTLKRPRDQALAIQTARWIVPLVAPFCVEYGDRR